MEDEQPHRTEKHPKMPIDVAKKVESKIVNTDETSTEEVNQKDDSHYKKMYQLKDLEVEIVRCDKIWETLKLIRNVQGPKGTRKNPKGSARRQNTATKNPSCTSRTKFTIKIMGKRRIFQCNVCGKSYARFNSLRHHLFVHHQHHVPPGRRGVLFEHDKSRARYIEMIKEEKGDNKRKVQELAQGTVRKKIKLEPKDPEPEGPQDDAQDEPKSVAENLIKCILCRHTAKNIQRHVTEYHKIRYPELIVEQCLKQHEKKVTPAEPKTKVEPKMRPKKRPYIMKRRKMKVKRLKTEVPEMVKGLYPCSHCSAAFNNMRGYANHQRVHLGTTNQIKRKRPVKRAVKRPFKRLLNKVQQPGEKLDEPARLENSSLEGEEKDEGLQRGTSELTKRLEGDEGSKRKLPKRTLEEEAKESSKKQRADDETHEEALCECGRSFRNPHTLYLHKVECKWTRFGESSSTARHSSDRDSGIGINITIKKKNNSYEIVTKDKSTTSTETSSVNSASGEENEKDDRRSEKSCYFKENNVVIIQTAEDDEEVDIEDVSDRFDEDDNPECSSSSQLTEPNGSCQLSEVNSCNEATSTLAKLPVLKEVCRKPVTADDPHLSMDSVKPKGKPKPKPKYKSSDTILSLPIEALDSLLPISKERNLPMLKARRRALEQQCHCGKKFRSTYYLNLHVKKLHPNLLDCSYCETTLENYSDFDKHDCEVKQLAKADENLFKLQCPECKVYLEFSFENFDRHTMAQHFNPSMPYQCFLCGERFENVSKRKLHFRRHPIPPCKKCNLRLHYEYQMKHNLYHQGIGYPCHRCKRAYSKRCVMIKHKAAHVEKTEGYVTCDICAKEIKSSAYKKHKYMHTIEYSCQKCGEVRLGVSKLQLHIDQKHKDDYPYVSCKCCKMVFAVNTQLDKHIASGDCLAYKNEMVARNARIEDGIKFVPGKTSICVADSSGTLAMSSGASDDDEGARERTVSEYSNEEILQQNLEAAS